MPGESAGESAGVAVRTSEPWLDFFDANGNRYWFNFRTGQRTATAPAGHSALHLLSDPPASTRNSPSRDAEETGGEASEGAAPRERELRVALEPPSKHLL